MAPPRQQESERNFTKSAAVSTSCTFNNRQKIALRKTNCAVFLETILMLRSTTLAAWSGAQLQPASPVNADRPRTSYVITPIIARNERHKIFESIGSYNDDDYDEYSWPSTTTSIRSPPLLSSAWETKQQHTFGVFFCEHSCVVSLSKHCIPKPASLCPSESIQTFKQQQ